MKQLQTLTLLLVLVMTSAAFAAPLLPVPGSPQDAAGIADKALSNYTFDTDNQGWQMTYVGPSTGATYETLYANEPAGHTMSEGVPPGSIFEQVTDNIDQRAYWLGYIGAPQFLGDLADASIYSDVYSTANWQTLADGAGGDDGHVYARWVISASCGDGTYDMFISTRSASIDMNAFSGWQNFNVAMVPSNFIPWPNAVCGSHTFLDVMQNYDSLGLYLFSGTDDVENINGGTGTWGTIGGVSRVLHYGAFATAGDGVWGLDNVHAEGNSVATEQSSFGSLKALFR